MEELINGIRRVLVVIAAAILTAVLLVTGLVPGSCVWPLTALVLLGGLVYIAIVGDHVQQPSGVKLDLHAGHHRVNVISGGNESHPADRAEPPTGLEQNSHRLAFGLHLPLASLAD